MPDRDGAAWLLEAVAAEGVPVLFGNPGSTELPITDALARQDAVRYVLGLHEASVIGMADGWARATGGLAVANVHVQPGLANAMSGILNAARCRVPVLVTVGTWLTAGRSRRGWPRGRVRRRARGLRGGRGRWP